MASIPTNHNGFITAESTYGRFFRGEVAKLPIVGKDRLHELDSQIQESASRILRMFPLIVKTPVEVQGNLRDYYCEIHQILASDGNTTSQCVSSETAAGTQHMALATSAAKPVVSKKRKAPEEIASPVKAARQELKREFIGGDTELARYLQEKVEKLPIVKTMKEAKQLRKDQIFDISHAAIVKFGLNTPPRRITKKIFNCYCKYRSLLAPGLTPKEKSAVLAAVPRYRTGDVIHWAQLKKDLNLDHALIDDVRNVLTRKGRELLFSQSEEAFSRARSKPRSSTSFATAAACSTSLPSSAEVGENEYLLKLFELLEESDEEEESDRTETVSSTSASPSSRTALSLSTTGERSSSGFSRS